VKSVLFCANLGLVLLVATACAPPMIEVEGRQVYNPAWAWALEVRRDGWQQPDEVLAALALPETAVIADVGAGGGYFTERFARALPSGHVFASDVQDGMIERLTTRVHERELSNVTVVRGDFDDPGLPSECCDLVFFSSVYKEILGRVAYMQRVRPLLRPGGRVAILEFLPGALSGPPQAMRLSPEAIIDELDQAGFALVERHDFLERESFLVFAADTDPGADPRAAQASPSRHRP
jgi:ubiquinone/menaquinone biosynthesis C-methylase UbiE